MLLQVLQYIKKQSLVSNQQIAREFSIALSALEPLLELGTRKGLIQTLLAPSCKKTCGGCKPSNLIYYQAC